MRAQSKISQFDATQSHVDCRRSLCGRTSSEVVAVTRSGHVIENRAKLVPKVAETARMTQNWPNVHRTWPVGRLDLIAAFLEGLG